MILLNKGRWTRMKRNIHSFVRVIALCVVFSLLIANSAFAIGLSEQLAPSSNFISNKVNDRVYIADNIYIVGYIDEFGRSVLCEYVDNQLTQRNTIYPNGNTIKREYFLDQYAVNYIQAHDYITTTQIPIITPAANKTGSGTIDFRTMTAYGYYNYTMKCDYEETYIGQTSHTLKSFTGKLIDAVTIITSALGIPALPQTVNLIIKLMAAAGAYVIDQYVTEIFSDTFSCVQRDYDWEIYDINTPSEKKYQTGSSFFINDVKSGLLGEYVSDDGYSPVDWGTTKMASGFHNFVFAYQNWEVVRWSTLT